MKNYTNRFWKMGVSNRIIKIVIILIYLFCFGEFKLYGTTPLLNDFTITFDWDAENYNQDAIPVYSDDESIRQNPNIFEFAYIINTIPSVKITIDSDCDDDFILLIDAIVTGGTGFDICHRDYSYSHHGGNFYFDVPIPDYVSKMNFTWEWIITAIPICGTSGEFSANTLSKSTEQHLFIILDEPTAPMEPPWASVLSYACDWASGQTTTLNVISSLTESLYYIGVEYNGYEHYTKDSYTNLDLTSLLNDLSYPEDMQMDCRDFSNFLHVLTNALGVTGEYNRIDMGCYYNYLFPAGWTSKANPGYWNYHQVGWYSSKVADAATKIDNDADPTGSPHDWKLAVGDMTLTNYLDKLTEYSVESVATGVCTVY